MFQIQILLFLSVLVALAHSVPQAQSVSKPQSSSVPQALSQAVAGGPSGIAPSYRQAPGQQPYGLSYAMSPYFASSPYAQQSQSILPTRFLALPARRRSSFSSKLRNFMNAIFFRQGKPTYTTDGFAYDPSVASKPFYLSPTSYKPISVPVRQLQKYYKPYSTAESSFIPTYVSPFASANQNSYSTAGLGSSSALSSALSSNSALTNGVYGSSSYAYPVQSSYNVGGYQLPSGSAFGSTYKRSSTGAATYTNGSPQGGGKVSFLKS